MRKDKNYYMVMGIKDYDPLSKDANKFIGRKCEFMGDIGMNADGSRYGKFGFPDVRMIFFFKGIMLKICSDEEDIL